VGCNVDDGAAEDGAAEDDGAGSVEGVGAPEAALDGGLSGVLWPPAVEAVARTSPTANRQTRDHRIVSSVTRKAGVTLPKPGSHGLHDHGCALTWCRMATAARSTRGDGPVNRTRLAVVSGL